MIDFEVVGDLLRRAKIPQQVKMKETPVIVVNDGEADIYFVFDTAGNLKQIVHVH